MGQTEVFHRVGEPGFLHVVLEVFLTCLGLQLLLYSSPQDICKTKCVQARQDYIQNEQKKGLHLILSGQLDTEESSRHFKVL